MISTSRSSTRMTRRLVRVTVLVPLLLMLVMGCSTRTMRGEASWYGGKFHGRTTASGEVYDKNGLTAAHKNLPFHTRVRVTNMETGRSVVVRVNDRFPGTRGRIIDLSEAAFARLAPLERGVIPVELEVVD